ncbi:MAG: 16S rRNA (uracil(1498)-N(3))-methyltransferase [Bacteroidia bacterium]|nr:16S rRNA (uracil(1498)-N(3))-methyltransferase [Bacteroidia bacterium]
MDNFFGDINAEGKLVLSKDELAHCMRVMRKQVGDRIGVLNGKGCLWEAEVELNTNKTGEVKMLAKTHATPTLNYKFHLAVAPTKSADRIEWLLEKAIETGIHRLTLIYTQRTERKHTNVERLEKIAVAAAKQSGQLLLPEINESKFLDFIQSCKAQAKFIAACPDLDGIQPVSALKVQKEICILVGPEGDFTPEEYQNAIQAGFQPISLGKQRFRTETAALMAVMAKFAYDN